MDAQGLKAHQDDENIIVEIIAPYIKPCVVHVCHVMIPYLLVYTLFLILAIAFVIYWMIQTLSS